MTIAGDEPNDRGAVAALSEVIRDGAAGRTPAELAQGLSTLLTRIAAERRRRRRFVRWSAVGVVALFCVGVGLHLAFDALRRPRGQAPMVLTYQIEGGSVLDGGYLREAGHAGIKLRFNEGSALSLAPGTRGRLRAVDREGARVAIEKGSASFRIVPSGERRWFVEVGPFMVAVKGTVFTVVWDPSAERFELSLRRGRVVVSGPMSGGDIALRAGQRLVVSLTSAETVIVEDQPEGSPREVAAPADSPAPPPATERARDGRGRPAASNPSATRSTPAAPAMLSGKFADRRRWTDELARGHWDSILEEVERIGTDAAIDEASSEDLLALADAARYRRRTDLARAALLAEQRRFPGSRRALDAVFLLGRVEEAREHGTAQAIAWYSEYLTRASSGSYAAEALGRKMILTSELKGPDQARPVAEEYLRRFPRGSYADAARTLSRVP